MTSKQAFKAAVLAELANGGDPLDRVRDVLKTAVDRCATFRKSAFLGAMAKGIGDFGGKVVSTVGPFAMLAALGLPVAAGVVGGRALAKAQDDDTNLEAAQADEKIRMYQQLAHEAKRRQEGGHLAVV